MKHSVRYQILTILGKVRVDIRLTVDEVKNPEYLSTFELTKSTILTLYPIVSVNLLKPMETDENGNRTKGAWNPNDSLGMTKYNFPIFINELSGIQQDLKIPELYTYQGKRLELNEEAASKIRRVFLIGNTTIELSAIVLIQPLDESRVEGIKVKFNNEQSSVLLTLNELDALVYNLQHMDIDSISIMLYQNYIKDSLGIVNDPIVSNKPVVDIVIPKKSEFEPEPLPS